VPLAAIAIDLDKALDVQALDSTKVTFDLVIAALLNLFANFVDFLLAQILHTAIIGNADFLADFGGGSSTDTVNIGKGDRGSLISR